MKTFAMALLAASLLPATAALAEGGAGTNMMDPATGQLAYERPYDMEPAYDVRHPHVVIVPGYAAGAIYDDYPSPELSFNYD